MKSLIIAKEKEVSCFKECFFDLNNYLIKIANKPLIEYFIDFLSILEVEELKIVSSGSTKELEKHLGTGAKWGIKISYGLVHEDDSLNLIYLKNRSFCAGDDLLIFNGFFFLSYKRDELKESFKPVEASSCLNQRMLYIPKGQSVEDALATEHVEDKCFKVREITNLKDYYELNMHILKHESMNYVLPGYSNQKDAFLGLNLVYPRSAELIPLLMVGNKCRFQKNSLIGPNAIIGDNIMVDENSSIRDSIVMDNTYIGKDLELDHKIVYKNILICGQTGVFIKSQDKILFSQIEQGLSITSFNRLIQRIIALIFLLLQLPLWLLFFLPYCLFVSNIRSERIIDKELNILCLIDPFLMRESLWGRFLLHLSLDKFDKIYRAVFKGDIEFIGNRLFHNSIENRRAVHELPAYKPGAFSFAESEGGLTKEVDIFFELEYISKVSTRTNIKIFVKTIFSRLFKGISD